MMNLSFLAPAQLQELAVIRDSDAFDRAWYSDRYPDVNALGIEPDMHYVWIGAALGRDPAPEFSTRFYLDHYPDVAQAGVNPFFHYVSSGREQGRVALPLSSEYRPARTAQYRIDRHSEIRSDQDWLLFVAYCPDGRLSRCQRYQVNSFQEAGYRVALIINSDDFTNLVNPGCSNSNIQIVRENIGFDFGAWRHAIEILGGIDSARTVTFANDSMMPVPGRGSLINLRQRIDQVDATVVFMTDNLEVKPHSQSYLFRIGKEGLRRNALSILRDVPYHTDKSALIHGVEINLAERFCQMGHSVRTLFPLSGVEDNPTIHHWEKLLDLGLPIIKVQLVTAGILDIDDPRLIERLDGQVLQWLREHCEARSLGSPLRALDRNVPPVAAMSTTGRFNEHGAQQAFNLPTSQNPTILLPFQGISAETVNFPHIVAIVHGYYVDVVENLLDQLTKLQIPMRVMVTTDDEEKVQTIRALITGFGLTGDAVLCPNRGRDVGPFLIEGARIAEGADYVLHLHTKKSLHDQVYAGWGSFLYNNLIGSREIVLSILKMFQDTGVGLIYSDHFPAVVGLRNWGYDFDQAHHLLASMNIRIDADTVLEFPTSTMFWARREALEPLFNAGLDYDDFEEEAGQIDGTLAHAIERSFLYVTQSAGFSYAKVTALDMPSEVGAPMLRLSAAELPYALDRPARFLPGDSTVRSDFYRAVPEVYPVSVARSRNKRPRMTALLPTMQPRKIYGGITTALKVIEHIIDAAPRDIDLRVLITSDRVDASSIAEIGRRLKRSFALALPDEDVEGNTIVGVAENQHIPVCLRAGESYIATAWWTADLGYRLLDRQREMHHSSARLAYIIQDYEPGFYNWSNTYALAEATYRRPDETIAIINSEELTNFVLQRYSFAQASCIPYEINSHLAELIEPTEPDPVILVYGRPGVSRNCFELLCEGIRRWQARSPRKNSGYKIVFAGEDFDSAQMGALLNAENVGKLSLEEYADMLNKAAIGISLMVSPHPSYPPLEMATAGCVTITNAYEGKDLSRRAENIISLDSLTPECLADCIDTAVSRVVYKLKKQTCEMKALETLAPAADFNHIAEWILKTE
jgi:hypothetical protein